jgi:hypothetical protein
MPRALVTVDGTLDSIRFDGSITTPGASSYDSLHINLGSCNTYIHLEPTDSCMFPKIFVVRNAKDQYFLVPNFHETSHSFPEFLAAAIRFPTKDIP